MNVDLIIILGVFFASVFQTITGFGIAVMLVPFFLNFYPFSVSVVYGLVITVISCFLISANSIKYIKLNLITVMFIASVPGNIVGLYIVQGNNEVLLQKIIGVLTIIFSALLLLGFKKPAKAENKGAGIVGFTSGVLSSSFGMPGPPVTLFGVNQGYEKHVFRASLNTYFFLVSLFSLFLIHFRYNYHLMLYLEPLKFIIPLVAGYVLGNILFKYVPVEIIYKAALVLTIALGYLILK